MRGACVVVALLAVAPSVRADDAGEDVEITAGVVTGLQCALEAQTKKDLTLLGACPPAEARKELVVFDVAERRIYRISTKKVFRYQLERAFGGGSIDFSGRVVKSDDKSGIAVVDVKDYSIQKKPKPGASKACM